jgi:hypothetical protein
LSFSILCYCEKSKLLNTEQIYLDYYFEIYPNNTLNVLKFAGRPTGHIQSDESKLKRSQSLKGRVFSDETRKKISDANKGRKYSKERCDAMSQQQSKLSASFISPTGEIYENVTQIVKFCKENDLCSVNVYAMIKGKCGSVKGWRIYYEGIGPLEHRYTVSLISPSGDVYENIHNINKFCKEHNIEVSAMSEMINGKRNRKSINGWQIYTDGVTPKKKLIILFLSPDGIVHEWSDRISFFCDKHGLHKSSTYAVVKGKRKSVQGWTVIGTKEVEYYYEK